MQEIAYLIERGQRQRQEPTIWWAGGRVVGEWTDQINLAVRFSRRGDAEIVGSMMPQLGPIWAMWTVTEHAWDLNGQLAT